MRDRQFSPLAKQSRLPQNPSSWLEVVLSIGGTLIAGSVGAIPLSDCGDQFVCTRQRRWDDLNSLFHPGLRLRSSWLT